MNCVFESVELNPVTKMLRLRGRLLNQYPIDIRIFGAPEELNRLKDYLTITVEPNYQGDLTMKNE